MIRYFKRRGSVGNIGNVGSVGTIGSVSIVGTVSMVGIVSCVGIVGNCWQLAVLALLAAQDFDYSYGLVHFSVSVCVYIT